MHLSGEGRSEESQQIQELGEGIPVEGWPPTKLVRSSVGQGQCGWHATTEEEEEMGTGSSCRVPYQDSFLCGPLRVFNRVTASSFSGTLVAGMLWGKRESETLGFHKAAAATTCLLQWPGDQAVLSMV